MVILLSAKHLFIYMNQQCDVRWNGSYSLKFPVSNGVRQGAVSSPLFFSLYVDNLIKELRTSGIGCSIGGIYVGIIVYADDIFLLSASRQGLQSMVNICDDFAQKHNLRFSTNPDVEKSKTKSIIFSKNLRDQLLVAPIILNGTPLPWVQKLKHLGNILQNDNSMEHDMGSKRGKFIGKIHSLNQDLHFCSPHLLIKLYNIYCCSFYGSSLYDLFSANLERFYSSWNMAIKILFKLPYATHKYLIETISKSLHPKVMMCSRFITYIKQCMVSSKRIVCFLANHCHGDLRTQVGRNNHGITSNCSRSFEELSSFKVKTSMGYAAVPEDESWRVDLIRELIENQVDVPLSKDEMEDILLFACTS